MLHLWTGTLPLLGTIRLKEENDYLIALDLLCDNDRQSGRKASTENAREYQQQTPLLREAVRQLHAYLAGRLHTFHLPLAPHGTPFQQNVWAALCTIPYGETRSYKQVAEMLGNPKACRAVGMANNRNPIAVIIPCHRVIGARGTLVGYGGGLLLKKRLLELEGSF